jgi:hypothetical protein
LRNWYDVFPEFKDIDVSSEISHIELRYI